jgi:hypothetical protein
MNGCGLEQREVLTTPFLEEARFCNFFPKVKGGYFEKRAG